MFGFSKPTGKKVFVGLSGGVDSAVSAALLQRQGYDVTGVFIRIKLQGYPCSAGSDRLEAMRVAAHLRIPFIEIDLSKEYTDHVFRAAIDAYTVGHTPNPDALCNREIKFGGFFNFAMAHGADFVATGHYAQTRDALLLEGKDPKKDQSYFLWAVPKEALEKTLFPVGGMEKTNVRALAEKYNLPNASRKDSQGLCFLGDIQIEDMLEREVTLEKGEVLSEEGEVVGAHGGVQQYTLGQRHGFTLLATTPQTVPHFVIAKDIEKNTITVSPNQFPQYAKKTRITLREVNWITIPTKSTYKARFRYRQKLIPAQYENETTVVLEEPHYVPLGQSLVLYDNDVCVGGGIVDMSELVAQ